MSSRVTTRYGVSLSGVSTLAQMLNLPSFQHLFTKGFQTFVVWAYPLTVSDGFWLNGVTAGEQTAHYNEIYDLVVAMRNSPALAGRTVMLGHWEGDNWLGTSSGADPGATAINGMKDYYRLRQNAVNAARAATPSSTVAVYHYAEVNAVLQTQWNPGWVTVSHNVLNDPTVQVDLISYSCWEASTVQPFNASYLTWSLSDIESHAHFTSAFPGAKKVYLGEFGFPRVWDATTFSTEIEQRDQCRAVIKTAVGWGVPFTFYWQMYNNETTPLQRGFWLIDDTNVKQLVWHDHHDFLGKANTFKNQYRYWLARNPDNSAFGSFAGGYDTFNASNQLNTILDSAEHASLKTNAQYLSLLFSDLLNVANAPADPDYAGYLAQLAGGTPRSVVLNNTLNSPRFEALVGGHGVRTPPLSQDARARDGGRGRRGVPGHADAARLHRAVHRLARIPQLPRVPREGTGPARHSKRHGSRRHRQAVLRPHLPQPRRGVAAARVAGEGRPPVGSVWRSPRPFHLLDTDLAAGFASAELDEHCVPAAGR